MNAGEPPSCNSVGCSPALPEPEKNWQYVYLGIRGAFEPEDISRFLGLEPTKTRRQSEGKTPSSREFAIWDFRPTEAEGTSIEDQLSTLIAVLLPKVELLKRVAMDHAVVIQIVGNFGPEGYPGLVFDEITVKGLGQLGLPVDFDLYGWKEPDDIEF